MVSRKIRRLPITWVLILSLFVGCSVFVGCHAEPAAEPEVVLGLIASITGKHPSGKMTVDGVLLAMEEVNDAGGVWVDGQRHELRLLVEDSGAIPEVAISKAQKLISKDRVSALLGVQISLDAIPVSKVAEQHRVPMLTTLATHPDVTTGKDYSFRMIFTDAFQARVLAALVSQDLEMRRAAIMVEAGSNYSSMFSEIFSAAFQELGSEVVATEIFASDAEDFSVQFEKILAAEPDFVLAPLSPFLIERLVLAAREAGVEVPFVGADTWGVYKPENPLRGKSYYTDVWVATADDKRSRDFVQAFEAKYQRPPSSAAAIAYDGLHLLVSVIEAQKSTSPESIRQGLAATDGFHGVTGIVRFRDSGDPARSAILVRLSANGERQAVQRIDPEEG